MDPGLWVLASTLAWSQEAMRVLLAELGETMSGPQPLSGKGQEELPGDDPGPVSSG